MKSSRLLTGRKARLTAVTPADMSTIARWWHDPEFLRLYNASPAMPLNEEQISRRFEVSQPNPENFLFAVRPVDSESIIGLLELDGVSWSNRTTFVSIGIGDPEHRGQGYGGEAMKLALGFAFGELNLHRVCLTVFSYNTAAISLYERLGFTREGVYREHLERDGRRHDMILYGILRPEWEKQAANGPD